MIKVIEIESETLIATSGYTETPGDAPTQNGGSLDVASYRTTLWGED